MKKALITGITGQDGAYLAKLLLDKNYKVFGLVRRSAERNFSRLNKLNITERIEFIDGDLSDRESLFNAFIKADPDEVYNLGAMSFVGSSFATPEYVQRVNGDAVFYMLEIIRNYAPNIKFYQASTSEIYGNANNRGSLLVEDSRKEPASPYGISKLYAHNYVELYRRAYNLFATSGILFNHESPLQGSEFVTKKIANYVKDYKAGKTQEALQLGNLNAQRDWGYAGDYVEAMYEMMQYEKPDTYVICTGEAHSVKEFVDIAFAHVGIPIVWTGTEKDAKGLGSFNEVLVEVNEKFYRPEDVHYLCGDAYKAYTRFGWKPKVSFEQLIIKMIEDEN